ncbi:MAG: hypothetical protein ACRDC4_03815 [Plesiomonas sp.]
MEVVTRAVARLNIDWPADQQEARQPKSKLDERFLPTRLQPLKRGLPFFPDLHTEVSKSWIKPASFRVFNPATSEYSNIMGLSEHGYAAMPRVEETLASYLSPVSASSLKAPQLPTKPVKATSDLVGRAYSAAGQAAACLHTMAVLQAYQADLLKDIDKNCEEIEGETIVEVISLQATKEAAKSIGRSIAALVKSVRHQR